MPQITINTNSRSNYNEGVIGKSFAPTTVMIRAGKLKRSHLISLAIDDWAKDIQAGKNDNRWEMVSMVQLYSEMLESGDYSTSTIYVTDERMIEQAELIWRYLEGYGTRMSVRIPNLHVPRGSGRNLRMVYWLCLERYARKLLRQR